MLSLLPVVTYEVVTLNTKDRIHYNVDSIPYHEVCMVLGTGSTTVTEHGICFKCRGAKTIAFHQYEMTK